MVQQDYGLYKTIGQSISCLVLSLLYGPTRLWSIQDYWSKLCFLPVVVYRCERWAIKKAEHQTIDAFELWCWRRLLRVPSTARRSNQSILKEINFDYSLEGLMLKLQYAGHLIERTDSLEKTLMLGKMGRAGV